LDYSSNSENTNVNEKVEETSMEGNEAVLNLTLILNKERNDLEIEKKDQDVNNEDDRDEKYWETSNRRKSNAIAR
jgi:hypothetical protein